MGTDLTSVVIFEGIATVSVAGVEHDTYMTVKTEAVGYSIRWFGSFGWMGDKPDVFLAPIVADVVLSDGRECQIKVTGEHEATWEFLGLGNPPGFEGLQPELVTAELTSTTPIWRVWSSRLFGLASVVLMFGAIWSSDEAQWRMIASGVLAMFIAIGLVPTRPKPLPEVPSDCPHQ